MSIPFLRVVAISLPIMVIAACGGPDQATWVCAGQPDLLVTTYDDRVAITSSDGNQLTLSKVENPSGAFYAGPGVEWIPRGTQALLTRDGSTLNCRMLRNRQ